MAATGRASGPGSAGRRRPGASGPPRGAGTGYRGCPAEVRALATLIKLLRAARWTSLQVGRVREAAGYTEAQFGVLEAIFHLGPMVQTDLAGKLLSSASNLTLVIDNLVRERLVVRRVSPRDRRCQEIHLTRKGRERIRRLFPRHVERVVEVMSALSPPEQERLAFLCRKLGLAAAELNRTDAAPPGS